MNSSARAPIAVALDTPDLAQVRELTRAVAPVVSTVKIGLELFLRHGRDAVAAVSETADEVGHPLGVFLDLKLHDIPNTVAGAAAAVSDINPTYLTVHASGGTEMVEAAARMLRSTRVTAVTVLTSLSEENLKSVGLTGPAREAAVRLAALSVSAGARAVVCSPREVAAIRAAVPRDVHLITPGVRPAGASLGDQRRTATPEHAMADGADLLVVGRPITGADDPATAAAGIAESIRGYW